MREKAIMFTEFPIATRPKAGYFSANELTALPGQAAVYV